MSETVAPSGMTPEETIAYNNELARQTKMLAGGAGASVATNVAPDPALPGVLSYAPLAGGIERLLGFAGTVGNLAASPIDAAMRALHIPVQTPPTPEFLKAAPAHAEATTKKIYESVPGLPPVDPNNPTDVANYGLGEGLGAMAPVGPAGVLSGLPATGAKVLHYVLPLTEGGLTRTTIGTTLGALSSSLDAQAVGDTQQPAQPQQPPATTDGTPAPTQEASLVGKTLTDLSTGVSAPAPDATTKQPAQSALTTAWPQLTSPTDGVAPPTFGAEGESGTSVGRMLLEYGGLVAAVGAGLFTHRLGSVVTDAGRDTRMNDPTYAQQAADYNNARLAQTSGTEISPGITPADQPQAPQVKPAFNIPGTNTSVQNVVKPVTTQVRGAMLDANAPAQEYMSLTSNDPPALDRMVAQYGMTHNNAAWESRIQEFMKTGRDFVTGETVPSPKAQLDDVAALSDADKKIYSDTREARDEQNDRTNNANKGLTNTAHDFQHLNDTQLQDLVDRGMSNPVVAELVERADLINAGIPRIGNARGFFPDQEYNRITAEHPNYLAETMSDGTIAHPLGPRDSTAATGISRSITPAWSADAQHWEALYRQFELNENARMVIDHQLDVQKQYPNSAQTVEKITGPPVAAQPSLYFGGGSREPSITIRRSGSTDRYRVDDPNLLSIARGDNANKQRTMLNSMSVARRMVTQMTTGSGAMLSGRAFPLTHLPRVMIQSAVNLPRNRVSGLSDAAMRLATGGRVGQRMIPDPTFLAGAGYSAARSAADNLAFKLSDMLRKENTNNIANRMLRSILTDPQVDAMSKSLSDYYHSTTTHEMQALGVTGAGNVLKSELPAYIGPEGAKVRLASNAQVPQLFMVDGKLGGVRPYIIRLRQAIDGTLTGLNDSGNNYIYRLNKVYNPSVVPESLGYDVRRMIGDPGEMGSSRFAQAAATNLPYFNTSLQGTRATMRAFGAHPLGTSMAMVGQLGSLAALSILTAMRSQQHVDHLQNTLSLQQREANPTFYTDPDPSKNIQISLTQEFQRVVYPIMLDLMSKGFNLTAALHHAGSANDVQTALKDFLSEHVENSSLDSMLHGLTDATSFADVPPLVNAFVAATGNTIHGLDYAKIYNDLQTHQFGYNSFIQPTGGTHVLPNQVVGDSILDGENGKRTSAILSSIFGMFGRTLDDYAGFQRYYKQTGDFWGSLGTAGRDWLQGSRDSNPEMNTWVWENQARASFRAPIVEDTQNRLRAISVTKGGFRPELLQGTTGGKIPLPIPDAGTDHTIPTDPAMRNLWFQTSEMYKFIDSNLMPEIKSLEAQRGAISSQALGPEDKRIQMNKSTREIADKYRLVKTYLDDLDAGLSAQVGKHVNAATINWKGNASQFHN